ncbi:unnamed protein product [Psylliodes chrysocephalus]|uniref:Attacin C-terminal domain-containing protein n=1 Tax=Psylliodes chrysocephalus TaxID=3402493 RepID=A0A9P0D2G8_9CUCU|nr:unnamed protein product [Psylliodes chrysocephala]
MKSFIVFAVFVAISVALPFEVFEDETGQEFVLVPVQRQRRDVTWLVDEDKYGLGQKGKFFSNNNHQFDGSYGASKAWGSHGLKPDTFGGRLDYINKPSGSTGFVGVDRTPGYGTDVTAGAKYNIAQGKNWGADVTGQYGRHFGGPGGTGKPEAGVSLNVEGKF